MMDSYEAYIGLNMIRNLGPVRIEALVEMLGSPEAVFETDASGLCSVKGIGQKLAGEILRQRDEVDVDGEIRRAADMNVRILTRESPEYPSVLKTIYDPPVVLYVCGRILQQDKHAFAMIGSRRCSHYGIRTADRLAYQLAKMGYTVVSGLAVGIDTASHEGAVKAGGRTLAVLGGAIDKLYPEENRKLSAKIVKQGALISEFPLGREPDRTTFPYRNRIVSGMCMGVVVVESPAKSGSLITTDMAAEQGRPVFAVPGRIDSPMSQGCHQLIKNGAKLVASVEDIIEEFDLLTSVQQKQHARGTMKRPDVVLSAEETKIVKALGKGAVDLDTLARLAGLSSSSVSGVMLGLEMKRIVRMLPGRHVELCVSQDDIRA